MLPEKHEYNKMAQVEQELWWYRCLHYLVLDSVSRNFVGRDINIIDAGCGTGGLMLFLQEQGYTNPQGFDLSLDAVRICHQRRLNVAHENLLNIARRYSPASADVIVSNDTLCFLDEQERIDLVQQCFQVLSPGGLLILNLPALKYFRGIHDLSVGIKHRFFLQDALSLFDSSQFSIVKQIYWPFLLSPIVYLVRLAQRVKMRMIPSFEVQSDIDLPSPWFNRVLEGITRFENRWLPAKPFGSSLFLVAKKEKRAGELR
jgi:SAM-dependent methyltransferase